MRAYPFVYLQIMGIEKVGFGGQKLAEKKVKNKIKFFRKKFPRLPIQIDGGVKAYNVAELKRAGANRFVAGSGLFSGDFQANLKEFKKALK